MNTEKTHDPPPGQGDCSAYYIDCPARFVDLNDFDAVIGGCRSIKCFAAKAGVDFDDRPKGCVLLVAAIVAPPNRTKPVLVDALCKNDNGKVSKSVS